MSDPSPVTPTISLPAGFRFDEVLAEPRVTAAPTGPPSLGPLANFVGTWTGRGFNTIFRPDNSVTPTAFPTPVTPVPDNVLQTQPHDRATVIFSQSRQRPQPRIEVRGMLSLMAFPMCKPSRTSRREPPRGFTSSRAFG